MHTTRSWCHAAAGWAIAPEHGVEPAIRRGLNEVNRGIVSASHILRLVQ